MSTIGPWFRFRVFSSRTAHVGKAQVKITYDGGSHSDGETMNTLVQLHVDRDRDQGRGRELRALC